MVKHCVEAHEQADGFALFAMDRLKPLDDGRLRDLFERYERIVVVEDNFRSGLYNSICQVVVEQRIKQVHVQSISPVERFESRIGDTRYLDEKNGLTPEQIRVSLRQMKNDASLS
jgi:deoxyxylulose-5-phosphate synthase